jgi:hypothetical protein
MNELRERFIEDAKLCHPNKPLDFRTSTTKGQEGRFVDKKTHQLWLGYELAHTASMRIERGEESTGLMGSYIIGNHVGPGPKLITGFRPFVHRNKRLAFEEAQRLTEVLGKRFAVFRCIKDFQPTPVEV